MVMETLLRNGDQLASEMDNSYGQQISAIDKSNNVYVVDTGNNRVQKFDGNGNFITKWGSTGTADGQFNAPDRDKIGFEWKYICC